MEPGRRAPLDRRALLTLLVLLPAGACALLFALTRGDVEREPVGSANVSLAATGLVTAPPSIASAPERIAIRLPRASAADADRELARDDTARPVRDPRTEAEYLLELRTLLASDSDAFARRLESILAGAGPACEQFASLRAAYEASWPGTNDLCARTASARSREADPRAESVTQALVHWLGERASREERARAALDSIVWSAGPPAETIHRIRALRALVLAAPQADVALLAQRIHTEADPEVHSAGRAALDERDQPAAPSDSFQEFP